MIIKYDQIDLSKFEVSLRDLTKSLDDFSYNPNDCRTLDIFEDIVNTLKNQIAPMKMIYDYYNLLGIVCLSDLPFREELIKPISDNEIIIFSDFVSCIAEKEYSNAFQKLKMFIYSGENILSINEYQILKRMIFLFSKN